MGTFRRCDECQAEESGRQLPRGWTVTFGRAPAFQEFHRCRECSMAASPPSDAPPPPDQTFAREVRELAEDFGLSMTEPCPRRKR